ncbi:MAG TPA: L,D-transpeptidase [Telluria sp.]|nr:L,D-transpeptidase [Telluria sp.]
MKTAQLTLIAACLAGAFTSPAMAAKAPSPLTAEAVNAAGKDGAAAAKPGMAQVLRTQIMLDRAHFSSGEIDGMAGSNLRQAIIGYQKAKGIDGGGAMNAATWTALNADSADALTTYTIADADVAGPFQTIPEDMAEKAKLTALGYESAIEALGEKFHASPALLKRLNPGADLTKAGEQIVVPNVEGTEPLPKGGKIVVDKSSRTLTLLDTSGKAIAQFPASTGSEHDPLPVGNWKVTGISKNPTFHYNPKLFWDAEAGEKKATIPAGPNNPVGVAWISLSKPHYGIHGTPVPAAIGKTQSHGCIRLTNWDVTALTASVGGGTDVVLQD